MRRRWIFGLTLLGILPLTAAFGTAADVVRILVWDEQQPEQKQEQPRDYTYYQGEGGYSLRL